MNFKERYQYNPKTDLLGKGGFARVYKAHDVFLERDVALKFFKNDTPGKYDVISEIRQVIKLDHHNLVRYFDAELLETTNVHGETDLLQVAVMELMNAGDLKSFSAHNKDLSILKKLLTDILEGLGYLHKKGIIHRDMKPQNILLKNEDGELIAKIADFGISKKIDSGNSASSALLGSIEYMAPEQFNPQRYGINGKIGTGVDIWGFGVMVYELITNEALFGKRNSNTSSEQMIHQILYLEGAEEKINRLPEPFKAVVKACIERDAAKRVGSASALIELMKDFAENDFNRLKDEEPTRAIAYETRVLDKYIGQEATKPAKHVTPPNPPKPLTPLKPIKPEIQEKPRKPEKSPKASPGPEPQKSKAVIFVVLGTLLIIIGVGIYFLTSKNDSQTTADIPKPTDTVKTEVVKPEPVAVPTPTTVKEKEIPSAKMEIKQPIFNKPNQTPEPPVVHTKKEKPAKDPQVAINGLKAELNKPIDSVSINTIMRYIKDGADVNTSDDDGFTALMYTAMGNFTEEAKLLINKGANINAQDDDKFTALMYAAKYGSTENATLLLGKKADVNNKNKDSQRALDVAKDDEMRRLLISHGAIRGADL